MRGLVGYKPCENDGDAFRMAPFGIFCKPCMFGMAASCWGFANCVTAGLNWAGLPIKADGSIIAPLTGPTEVKVGSVMCGKPLPLWLGTAASFIQELMTLGFWVTDPSGRFCTAHDLSVIKNQKNKRHLHR